MATPELPRDDGLEALLARIAAEVRDRRPPRGMSTRIVAVDGHGGAGKSSFARHLARALDEAPIVQTDDFASWKNPVDWWPQLLERVLVPLARNEPARFEPSHWGVERDAEPVEVAPTDFVVLEGVTASREAFARYLTYSIWIEAPAELRLQRGLARDGPDAREQWQAWMAAEDAYVERERPDERADLVIPGDRDVWT